MRLGGVVEFIGVCVVLCALLPSIGLVLGVVDGVDCVGEVCAESEGLLAGGMVVCATAMPVPTMTAATAVEIKKFDAFMSRLLEMLRGKPVAVPTLPDDSRVSGAIGEVDRSMPGRHVGKCPKRKLP